MPITRASVVQRRHNALSAEVGGELVLMSVERGKYYGLDAISTDVWKRLERPTVVGELCDALSREYSGESSLIEQDVISLLEKLAEQDLLEPVNA